jgi:hypothetical protein
MDFYSRLYFVINFLYISGMKKVILVLAIGFLASCKKDEPQPTGCNCYKAYEQFTMGQWQPYYDTPEELKPCEINGELNYEGANVRYTWVCH